MADAKTAGYDYVPGHPTPGYGATLGERLHAYQGQNVRVYVGPELSEVAGMLHQVGPNYVEVHRMGANGVQEAVFIPMQNIGTVITAAHGTPHHP